MGRGERGPMMNDGLDRMKLHPTRWRRRATCTIGSGLQHASWTSTYVTSRALPVVVQDVR